MDRWDDDVFHASRQDVLGRWPTGAEVDLDEAVAYMSALPAHKVHVDVVRHAIDRGVPAIQVGFGHATIDDVLSHLAIAREAGAELVYVHVDTYTRKNEYAKATDAIKESVERGSSVLNGFPYVSHGVHGSRQLVEGSDIAIRFGGSNDEEPMLSAEIGFGAGISCTGNFDFHDLVQHSRDYPLDKRIKNAQYNDRLAAHYQERGAPAHIVQVGNIHGFVPPGLLMAVELLHTILSAAQGVKHTTLGPGLMVHVVQDIATLRLYRRLAREYLTRFGFDDVELFLYYWPWMSDWPLDDFEAAALATICASTAILAGVDYMYVKSIEEAKSASYPRGTAAAIRATVQALRALNGQRFPESDELAEESAMLEAEVRAIIDRVIELGDGDVARGMVKAVETGNLDTPFPSWEGVKGAVIATRDATGAMRYVRPGGLPLPPEVLRFHEAKIRERIPSDKLSEELRALANDLVAMSSADIFAEVDPHVENKTVLGR
jgi:methylaspartate mutase epsilon subunit